MSKLCHCSIPKGGPERVTQTMLGKELKRKEGRERGRGTGKGEERKEGGKERKEGRKRRERERDRLESKPAETQPLCIISSSGGLRCKLALY